MTRPNTSSILTTLTPPYTLGQNTALLSIPAGYAIAGFDCALPALDSGATPTLKLDFGTTSGANDLAADSTIGQAGGTLALRGFLPLRYGVAGSVWMRVSVAAATSVGGSVTSTAYIYRAVSLVELRDRTLRKLQVSEAGQAPSAEDAAVTIEAIEALHARLEGLRLTQWGDAGTSAAASEDAAEASFGPIVWDLECVPMFAAQLYAIMAASDLADDFGVDGGRIGRLLQEASGAERELRRLVRIPYGRAPVEAEYF